MKRYGYVANTDWIGLPGSKKNNVTVIDTESRKVVARIPTGAPYSPVKSADKSLAYVSNTSARTITVIDAEANIVSRTIAIP